MSGWSFSLIQGGVGSAPPAAGAPVQEFIYRPAGPAAGNVYTSMAALKTALEAADGLKSLIFDGSGSGLVTVDAPVSIDLRNTVVTGLLSDFVTGLPRIVFPAGTVFTHPPRTLEIGIFVFDTSAGSLYTVPPAAVRAMQVNFATIEWSGNNDVINATAGFFIGTFDNLPTLVRTSGTGHFLNIGAVSGMTGVWTRGSGTPPWTGDIYLTGSGAFTFQFDSSYDGQALGFANHSGSLTLSLTLKTNNLPPQPGIFIYRPNERSLLQSDSKANYAVGDYVLLWDADDNPFYIHFDTTGADADPTPGGTKIYADISGDTTAADVIDTVVTALAGFTEFQSFVVGFGTMYIMTTKEGAATDIDGTNATGVTNASVLWQGGQNSGNQYGSWSSLEIALVLDTSTVKKVYIDIPGNGNKSDVPATSANIWNGVELLASPLSKVPVLSFADPSTFAVLPKKIQIGMEFQNTGANNVYQAALGIAAQIVELDGGYIKNNSAVVGLELFAINSTTSVDLIFDLKNGAELRTNTEKIFGGSGNGTVTIRAESGSKVESNIAESGGPWTFNFVPLDHSVDLSTTQGKTISWPSTNKLGRNNIVAGAPGVSNDNTEGYKAGQSTWIDITVPATPVVYMCTDDATGAAIWNAI